MTRAVYILLLLLLPLVSWSQKVVFTPQWTPQAQFAGYYVAQAMGFYEQAGLDVEIVHPSQTRHALGMLKDGTSDFITMDLLTGIAEQASSGSVVNLMQTSQLSGLVILSHTPLNNRLTNLNGKKIGRWKAGFSILANSALEASKVDFEWIDFMGGVNVFLSGAIDATLAMSYNELLSCRESGYAIGLDRIIFLNEIGYNMPEEGLYTLNTMDEDLARRFAEASKRGWLWAHDNPEQTLELVMEIVREAKISTNRTHQRDMLDEILRLQFNGLGQMTLRLDKDDFDRGVNLLRRSGEISRAIDYDSFIREY